MQPGSFIDLLMRAKDKTTGRGFTDMEIANQVIYIANPCFTTLSDACASMWPWHTPQHCVLEALHLLDFVAGSGFIPEDLWSFFRVVEGCFRAAR